MKVEKCSRIHRLWLQGIFLCILWLLTSPAISGGIKTQQQAGGARVQSMINVFSQNSLKIVNRITGVSGSRFGIKLNRARWEYPDRVLSDLKRLHEDRLDTVMLSLPWRSWANSGGLPDMAFIRERLTPVLQYCSENDIPVVLSVHNVFWGKKGDWSLPRSILLQPGFKSSTSILVQQAFREAYIGFLKALIDATKDWDVIVGYNILNEPVAATETFLNTKQKEFQRRWAAVIAISQAIRAYLSQYRQKSGKHKLLIVGNANGDPRLAKYVWKHTGKYDLTTFWKETVGVISGQRLDVLKEAGRWYAKSPKMRTEGYLSFAVHDAHARGEYYRWKKGIDRMAMYYDYDAVYDYEGKASLEVEDLRTVYVWRIGSPDGSHKHLRLLDHRNADRPTPYYFALRDLASGIDSFEAYSADSLPRNRAETVAFDPENVPPTISAYWHGTGKIKAARKHYDPLRSSMSAFIELGPGQNIMRTVVSSHWRANGVTSGDVFAFYAFARRKGDINLVVKADGAVIKAPVHIDGKKWKKYTIGLAMIGVDSGTIGKIDAIGFGNPGKLPVSFYVDDFLIREPERVK